MRWICPTASTAASIDRTTMPDCPSSMISETEPLSHAMTGVPLDIDSTITSPNGSGQSMGNRSASASPRKAFFCRSSISPMNSMAWVIQQGFDRRSEVFLIDRVDFCRDLQMDPAALSNLDRAIWSFFGRYAAEESEVFAAFRIERIKPRRQPVMDRCQPIYRRHGPALIV